MKTQLRQRAAIFALWLGTLTSLTTAQNVLFDKSYSPGPFNNAVAADPMGNVYVAGSAYAAIVLLKYDRLGNLQWQKGFEHLAGDYSDFPSLAVDQNGNSYVSYCENSAVLLTKFDNVGNFVWHRLWQVNELSNAAPYSCPVAVDASGNAFVAGAGRGFIPTGFSSVLGKFDPNGNLIWQRGYLSNNILPPLSMAVGPAGDVYFSGYCNGTGCIVKYDSAGNLVWQLSTDSFGSNTFLSGDLRDGLAVDSSGNVLVLLYVSADPTEIDLVQLDSAGNPIWRKGWVRNFRYQVPVGLATNALGAIYVATYDYPPPPYLSPQETELLRFDDSGNLVWQRSFAGAGDTNALGLAADDFGRVYATGDSAVASRNLAALNDSIVDIPVVPLSTVANVSFDIFATVDSSPLPVADLNGTSTFSAPQSLFLLALQDDNTPLGNSTIQPIDSTTGTTPVSLTFSNVTQGGITSLTTSGTGQSPPSGFTLGNPPTYYELSTTALFSGPVMVCINYSGISVGNESNLGLFHFSSGSWTNVTTSLDTTNNIICGSVTSLSPFAVFEAVYSASVQQPINADGSSIFNSNKGVIPVKFTLSLGGSSTCDLPPATISVVRTAGTVLGVVDESVYTGTADAGSNFRISGCQYVYNLLSKSLGIGTYRVDISVSGRIMGQAIFALK